MKYCGHKVKETEQSCNGVTKIEPIADAQSQNSTKFAKLTTKVEESRMMYENGDN